MKSLQTFSNSNLLLETKNLVEKERKATLELIECLQEVETRMLYASLGYSSLWQFCTQYLGLSEGSAQRRIAAMRLGRQVPEAKTALVNGKLSLSNAAKLESFFLNEKKGGRPQTPTQKRETLKKVEGLSQSECEKKLFQLSPQFEINQQETLKTISEDQSRLSIVLDSETVDQLKLLKDRLAHQFPNASYSELIEFLIQDKLSQIDKKKHPKSQTTAAAQVEAPAPAGQKTPNVPTQKALWKRSEGQCEYIAPDGRRCKSTHALEIDHIKSLALGGSHDLSNLRLVCRMHNGFFAKQVFGSTWMSQFLPRLRP